MISAEHFRKEFINIKTALLIGILLLFAITRLWQLTVLPFGIHIDEAGMAYDAWCLSQYGFDRYLKSWPVYMINFDGGQNSLYTFLCAFLFKIFGYSLYTIRMPAVIFSFLNLIFGMKLTSKLFPHRDYMPFAVGGLITICPYFIMAGRFGLESNLMLGMSTVFLYCFITAIEDGKISRYIFAGITGGLLLYTYALTYIIVPVFLAFSLIYLLRTKKFSLGGWGAMAIPLGLLAFPLILVQIVNIFDLNEFRLGCFTITKLPMYRASELQHFQFTLLQRAWNSIFWGDDLNYNTAPEYDNLYGITIIFFVMGLIVCLWKFFSSIKKREPKLSDIILLWAISMMIFEAHLTSNVNKINGIFFSIILVSVIGMDSIIQACHKLAGCIKSSHQFRKPLASVFSTAAAVGLICIYTLYFISFSVYYYGGTYSRETYLLSYFDLDISEAVNYIENDEILRQKETQMAESEIYYAAGTLTDPRKLMLWIEEEAPSYQNYRFGTLGEIHDYCNYIVRDGFEDYCAQLRASGFTEIRFNRYSLFYKK